MRLSNRWTWTRGTQWLNRLVAKHDEPSKPTTDEPSKPTTGNLAGDEQPDSLADEHEPLVASKPGREG